MVARISLYVVAALLLGAHFLRAANYLLVLLCLAAPLLFLHKRRISLLVLQAGAYAATGVWLWAALTLIGSRQQSGRPWALGAAILGAVAVFTLVSGLLLNSASLRERYTNSTHP